MKTLYTKYDKKTLVNLPKAEFEGRIIVIQSAGEARRAVDYLLRFPRLGIDTETRPNFKPGPMHSVALLQVATPDTCFLFRLNQIGLPQCLVRLLTDASSQKVGLSLHDDWAQLKRRVEFEPVNYVELQDYVKPLGIEDMSLQKIYANLFGRKISKNQRLSNWEADVLTEPQKRYAATDAWTCLQMYDEINRLLTTRDYKLVQAEASTLSAD
ncbi:MAG: 3'-5' exonuclease domain-containing protein 2 [Bacteroidales bacterium]|nr:3'-5' exonuclease domain-containing protein 2 [Bacteroidales bacterium]